MSMFWPEAFSQDNSQCSIVNMLSCGEHVVIETPAHQTILIIFSFALSYSSVTGRVSFCSEEIELNVVLYHILLRRSNVGIQKPGGEI